MPWTGILQFPPSAGLSCTCQHHPDTCMVTPDRVTTRSQHIQSWMKHSWDGFIIPNFWGMNSYRCSLLHGSSQTCQSAPGGSRIIAAALPSIRGWRICSSSVCRAEISQHTWFGWLLGHGKFPQERGKPPITHWFCIAKQLAAVGIAGWVIRATESHKTSFPKTNFPQISHFSSQCTTQKAFNPLHTPPAVNHTPADY